MSRRQRIACVITAVAAVAGAWGYASVAGTRLGSPGGCAAYDGVPPGWPQAPHSGMQLIRGGSYTPGSQQGYRDEWPMGQVSVGDFWIDRTEVTVAQFAAFVAATGYVTDAERQGGGALFRTPTAQDAQTSTLPWWHFVKGADWRHPQGPEAGEGPGHLPVSLVTLDDAQAYARWLGNQLPSEAQWEYAARGGKAQTQLSETPVDAQGRPTANYWQGVFPVVNTAEDGYVGPSPVGCFAANGYGLYDMIGNLWEWTRDLYTGAVQGHANGDPGQLGFLPLFNRHQQVIKGGSFLCAANYCMRYRASARERQEAELATAHVGFRTIREVGRAALVARP